VALAAVDTGEVQPEDIQNPTPWAAVAVVVDTFNLAQ
jgi:hypothetical protein